MSTENQNPVVRTPQEIEAQVANILGDVQEVIAEAPEVETEQDYDVDEPAPAPAPEVVVETEDVTPKHNPAWNILKKKLSTDNNPYELPSHIVSRKKADGTDLTEDEEFDELVSHIIANVEQEENDPFVAKYKAEAAKEGFNLNEFIKTYHNETDIFSLPSKDYLFSKMKQQVVAKKADWTDEEIETYLASKNRIELDMLANQAKASDKNAYAQQSKIQQEKTMQENRVKQDLAVKDLNTKIASQASVLMSKMVNESSIGGIPHGQAEVDEFAPYFNDLVSINPATGKPKLNELLDNDETLYRALYLLYNADKGKLTDFKERYKQEILEKTSLGKRTEGGTQRTVRVPKPDDFVS